MVDDGPGFVAALMAYDDEPVVLEAYQRVPHQPLAVPVGQQEPPGRLLVPLRARGARPPPLRSKHTGGRQLQHGRREGEVLTARQLHEELPLAYQKRLVVDSKTELAFESNGATKRLSRILSHPSKAPRGGKKGDVYLDELAHYVNDREVYRARRRSSSAATGSSPGAARRSAARHLLGDRQRGAAQVPHHTRQHVPWWLCRFFTTDVKAASRARPRPAHGGARRALRRPTLIEQFDLLPIEDFQQEFEGRSSTRRTASSPTS